MNIFSYAEDSKLGTIQSVDTAAVTVNVENKQLLSKIQVNSLVIIRASKAGQTLIGMVNKIAREYKSNYMELDEKDASNSSDVVIITLIGTYQERNGITRDVFKRTLQSVPEIDSDCFALKDKELTNFMAVISGKGSGFENCFCIGKYTISDTADAWLDGNKFFQQHTAIVGSAGSGKSYAVVTLIEKVATLPSCNVLLFDLHGEYEHVIGNNIQHYKIAGSEDTPETDKIFLPYWLLSYNEMFAMMIDSSDSSVSNQTMAFSSNIQLAKQEMCAENDQEELSTCITLDSPVPYKISEVLKNLDWLNTQIVREENGNKPGEYYGKMSRLIQSLESKMSDGRMNFMFSEDDALLNDDFLEELCKKIMAPACQGGGVKIIDFSEVPSEVLPIAISLLARLVLSVQQWSEESERNPMSIFCEEADLYIPENTQRESELCSLHSFERIAREGYKYGVGLVIISQHPSEVSRIVLSQSSNFIAMRLTNAEDQAVIQRLFPDSMGNFAELLPVLGVGEAIVVGDASLLPSRILIDEPVQKPNRATVDFWHAWGNDRLPDGISSAVEAMRLQSR